MKTKPDLCCDFKINTTDSVYKCISDFSKIVLSQYNEVFKAALNKNATYTCKY